MNWLTLFSAHAEVFPHPPANRPPAPALLRTRGGISTPNPIPVIPCVSSPHTRRYFQGLQPLDEFAQLFSAHAEVFPALIRLRHARRTLLRTRGGISPETIGYVANIRSSPHTRRYFRRWGFPTFLGKLFSAHAEVFPPPPSGASSKPSLLRTRGGISDERLT